jgi:hypothetical protein
VEGLTNREWNNFCSKPAFNLLTKCTAFGKVAAACCRAAPRKLYNLFLFLLLPLLIPSCTGTVVARKMENQSPSNFDDNAAGGGKPLTATG